MSDWNTHIPDELNEGDKILAVIRHCNPKLKLADEMVTLTQGTDNFYLNDGPDELSYNWDIVKWRRLEAE